MRARSIAWSLSLPLLLSSCFFYDSTWHQETQSQERQAAALTPDAPRAEGAGDRWRATRELRVRAWATARYRAEVHGFRAHVRQLLDRSNEVLGPALGVRLVLEDARSWDAGDTDSLADLLEALEQHDAGDGADLVIGLAGSTPRLAARFDTLGIARVHGKHLVVRAMNDAAESDAIDAAFDRLSDEERARLRRRRKAHKELAVLLHEIGHSHGAIHVRDTTALMSPIYDDAMVRFAPETIALMRLAAEERRKPEAERDHRAFARAIADVLRADEHGFVPDERDALLAHCEQVLTGGDTTPATQRAAATRDDGPRTLNDVTALPDDDRAALERVRETRGRTAWELLAPLVERHPDSYAVHELACELYHRRAAPSEAARSCQRMMDLASSYGAD